MQLKVSGGKVDLSGQNILSDVNIEINTQSRIAVVGRNGCGKTTLLRLLSGSLPLANTESDGGFMSKSGKFTVGMLDQMTFEDQNALMIDEIRLAYSEIIGMQERINALLEQMKTDDSARLIEEYTALLERFTNDGGFYFEKEYEAAIKKFGFSDADKYKTVSEFSGGQRTKLAFLKLLLSKPDLLLLDEPTNHLDVGAIGWLEDYLSNYKKAFVIVSHDRMFLDKTVNEVYEIEHGGMARYVGNYTEFTKKKKEQLEAKQKLYEAQQKEIARISATAERFRYKATKAAMAQSKLKQIERMEKIDAPQAADNRTFHTSLQIDTVSVKDVLTVNNLVIGYDKPLCKATFELKRGDRLGIIGGNGLGKSTLLKTLIGNLPAISGDFRFGAGVKIGYFDQQLARLEGNETVFDNYLTAFPRLSDFEVRSDLAAFMFSGEDVFKTVDKLSGGERVRLTLCKIFKNRPNVLVLDEPTNHMDIISKETLEDMLAEYEGTVLLVSHDRYFIKKLSNKLLCFENDEARFYEYGYEQYLNQVSQEPHNDNTVTFAAPQKKEKKTYTTPGKEKAKRERAIKKSEEKIASLEAEIEDINAQISQNVSDYVVLSELQEKLSQKEEELLNEMEHWEELQ